jgi:hypothetical protein
MNYPKNILFAALSLLLAAPLAAQVTIRHENNDEMMTINSGTNSNNFTAFDTKNGYIGYLGVWNGDFDMDFGTANATGKVHLVSGISVLPRLTVDATGKVGIGNISPTEKLQVDVAGRGGIYVKGNNTDDVFLRLDNGGGNHYIFDDDSDGHNLKLESANGFAINVGGTNQRLAMDITGRTSLNRATVANASQLYVQSSNSWSIFSNNDLSSSSSTYGIEAVAEGTGTGSRYGVRGEAGGSTGSRYGVYGFATAETGSWAGYFNGNFYYSGSWQAPSDSRLKKNIRSIDGALDKVMRLKPQSYEFKTEEYPYINLAKGRQMGFISQDVEKVFPELVQDAPHSFRLDNGRNKPGEGPVEETKINIKSMNYIGLVPVLTQAMQEQQQLISEQNSKIEALETELQDLKNAVQQLLTQQQNNGSLHLDGSGAARLDQNQPNPFNGQTTVKYFVPESARQAQLLVTDMSGRSLKTLQLGHTGEGQVDISTSDLPNGSYHYSLIIDGQTVATKQMVLVKGK